MASKTRIEDTRGKIDFSQSAEPTLNSEETKTGWFFIDWLVKGINFLWLKLKDLFPLTQATTHNYIPKIDNANKKLVKSNIQDDGTRVKIDSPLDLNKNSITNGGFEVVTSSLPTTNNFDGRQVTYEGRSYIWDGSEWKCDSDYLEIGGRNLLLDSKFIVGDTEAIAWIMHSYNNVSIVEGVARYTVYNASNAGRLERAISLEKGVYTVSIKAKTNTASFVLSMHQLINAQLISNQYQPITDNFSILKWTFEVTDTSSVTLRFYYSLNLQINEYIDVEWYKLEKGNIATDWTPAPEDKANVDHDHDGTYSTTDTKNTAGATDTSSKIYLVGSSEQSENPQTYTHDTAYVGTDGNLYSGNSKTVTNSDLETNQLYPPTLTPVWNIVKSDGTTPSGITKTTSAITIEYGYRPSATVQAKWTQPSGYNTPERSDGLCGSNLPAINTNTNSANLPYATHFAPANPTVTSKSVVVWTIYANKKGITVSGNKLIMPTGEISKSASLSVTYQLPIYYGVIDVNSMTEARIKALPSSMKNCSTGSKTFSPKINALDTQYWVYAYPSAWGELTNISNADGDWTAAFTTDLIDIESSDTLLTTQYRYYITVNKGAFKNKTINFS